MGCGATENLRATQRAAIGLNVRRQSGSWLVSRLLVFAHKGWRRIEEALGGVLALILAVAVMVALVLWAVEVRPDELPSAPWRWVMVAVVCGFEVMHVAAVCGAVGRHPFAPEVARLLPRLPVLIRLPAAIFWLLHLLLVCGFTSLVYWGSAGSAVAQRLFLMALGAALNCLAVGYLLNAAAALAGDDRWVLSLWRRRAWFVAVVTGVALLLPATGLVSGVRPGAGSTPQQTGAPGKATLPNPTLHPEGRP